MTGSLPTSSDAPSSSKKRKANYTEDSDDISVDSVSEPKEDARDYSYQPSEADNEAFENQFRAPAPPPVAVRAISAPGPIPPPLHTGIAGTPMSIEESPFFAIRDQTFPLHPNAQSQLQPSHHMAHGWRHTVADLSSITGSFGGPSSFTSGYVSCLALYPDFIVADHLSANSRAMSTDIRTRLMSVDCLTSTEGYLRLW